MASPSSFTQFSNTLIEKSDIPISITNTSTKRTISIPVNSFPFCLLRVITPDGVQYDIPQVLSFSTINSINPAELPQSQVTYVLAEGEPPLDIGPMSEVYLYAQYVETNIYDSSGLLSSALLASITDASGQIVNRVFTGLTTTCNKIRDPRMGEIYQLTFNSFIKKLHITNEFKATGSALTQGGTANSTPASLLPSVSLDYPGQLVQIAMQQSNLKYAYIFIPSGSVQNAFFSDSPSLSADIVTDLWGNRTKNIHFPLKSLIPFGQSLAQWQYQKWIQILASALDMSFCELFCSKYGQAYFRQAGMFRAAGDWDIEVDPELAISWSLGETDSNICTRLEVRFYNNGKGIVPHVWAPPDIDRLEQRYSGPRYNMVQAPWLPYAVAKFEKDHPEDKTANAINDWIRDFATFMLALANTSAVQGTIKLVGSNAFEVGQTIYFSPEDIVLYITDVKNDFVVGDKWTTTLTVNYGRSRDVDFLGYLAKGVSIIGDTETSVANPNAPASPFVNTLTSGQSDTDVPIQPSENAGNPFGQLQWVVSNPYGAHDGNTGEPEGHCGVDLLPVAEGSCSVVSNAAIYSVSEGVVTGLGTYLEFNAGWGNYICITSDNDVVYVYAHLSAYASGIVLGRRVSAGDPIGNMGTSGHVTGPHLHFQMQPKSVNQGMQPANLLHQTINPFKGIYKGGFSDACKTVVGGGYTPPDVLVTAPYATTFVNSLVVNNVQLYSDTNYWVDVNTWAQSVAQVIGAPTPDVIAFYIALSLQEVGDPTGTQIVGNQFTGFYNFVNVNSGINSVKDPNGDKVDHYVLGMAQAVQSTVNYLDSGRYADFVSYMQNYAGSLDPQIALRKLLAGGFKGNPSQTQIQNNLNNIAAAWGSVMNRLR